jgi:hypothetical protein
LISPFGIAMLNTLLLLTSGYFLTTGIAKSELIRFLRPGKDYFNDNVENQDNDNKERTTNFSLFPLNTFIVGNYQTKLDRNTILEIVNPHVILWERTEKLTITFKNLFLEDKISKREYEICQYVCGLIKENLAINKNTPILSRYNEFDKKDYLQTIKTFLDNFEAVSKDVTMLQNQLRAFVVQDIFSIKYPEQLFYFIFEPKLGKLYSVFENFDIAYFFFFLERYFFSSFIFLFFIFIIMLFWMLKYLTFNTSQEENLLLRSCTYL